MRALGNKKQLLVRVTTTLASSPLSRFDAVPLLFHGAYLLAQYPCYHHFIYNRVPCTVVSAKGCAKTLNLHTGE